MSTISQQKQKWALDSVDLQDALTDFVLSRQAMLCSPKTVEWYSWILGKFRDHLEAQGV